MEQLDPHLSQYVVGGTDFFEEPEALEIAAIAAFIFGAILFVIIPPEIL